MTGAILAFLTLGVSPAHAFCPYEYDIRCGLQTELRPRSVEGPDEDRVLGDWNTVAPVLYSGDCLLIPGSRVCFAPDATQAAAPFAQPDDPVASRLPMVLALMGCGDCGCPTLESLYQGVEWRTVTPLVAGFPGAPDAEPRAVEGSLRFNNDRTRATFEYGFADLRWQWTVVFVADEDSREVD